MFTRRKINAGEPGSKKYLEKYGEKLVCVRYKYDEEKSERVTTVELVESKGTGKRKAGIPYNKKVLVKINFDEHGLRNDIKMYGGRWNPDLKLWETNYKTASELNITSRIKQEPNISDNNNIEK